MLASIQKITNLSAIEGADKIEKATVLGWEVVVKKGEYKVDDLCVYIQIDTVVPDKPEFEFLRERNFRVRTIKLRGQISQGLIGSIPDFLHTTDTGKFKEGQDITELIGIKKYEKPDNNPNRFEKPRQPKVWYKKLIYKFKYNYLYKLFPNLRDKTRSPFPTHLVPITDEERIQNCPQILEKYKDQEFIASYKLDGSSITIIHQKGFWGESKFRICSRRFELHDKNNDWYKVFKSTNFEQHILKLVKYYNTDDIIVQGEAIGNFNGNHHNLKENEIRLFNIYVNGKRITQLELVFTCIELIIPFCPTFCRTIMRFTLPEILKISEIKDILNPNEEAEGLVWRSLDGKVSFKVINNKYLLKHE